MNDYGRERHSGSLAALTYRFLLHSCRASSQPPLCCIVMAVAAVERFEIVYQPEKAASFTITLNCEHISRLWHASKLQESKDDWSADVVIGNSRIQKSLYVKITLPIGPHLIEMSVEKFGALR
uniref:Galectin n=1 Tax=Parascaris equorum TaxID=6256 RepID=A0A914R586_PAREQ